MGEEIQTWRFSEHWDGCWYVAFLDSIGCIAVLSDYGDYSYRWNAPGGTGMEFRKFLLRCDDSYLLGKFTRRDEFDGAATQKAIYAEIVRLRRRWDLDKDQAREEWDRVPCFFNEVEFADWRRDSELFGDHAELAVYDTPRQAQGFMECVWPRLMAAVKATLEPKS